MGRFGAPKNNQKNMMAFGLIGVCMLAMVGFGFSAYQDSQYETMGKDYCYGQGDPGTLFFIDYSPPKWSPMARRGIDEYLKILYEVQLHGNERFWVYVTSRERLSDVPEEFMTMCRPPRTSAEAVQKGGQAVAEPWLNRKGLEAFHDQYWAKLSTLLDADIKKDQEVRESPILQYMQSLSRMPFLTGNQFNRLIVLSDLIENAEGVQFCSAPGHLPSFKKFTTKEFWPRLKPRSLKGVEVVILLLIRPYALYGYCQEGEVEGFWTAYYKDAGAKSVEIIRLREGV